MKNNSVLIYSVLGVFFAVVMFMFFYNNRLDLSKVANASASIPTNKEDDNKIIIQSKRMINENIEKYNGEVIITVKDLIRNNYLTNEEIVQDNIDENARVVAYIKNNNIEDIFIKNDLFKNIFSCDSVCYLNSNNYITFDNKVYQILKIDQQGNLYITDFKSRKVYNKNIEDSLKKYSFEIKDDTVKTIVSITTEDIIYSNFEIEDNLFVNSNSGYKYYNYIRETVENINGRSAKIIPVLELDSELSYEQGQGTKFNPFVLIK